MARLGDATWHHKRVTLGTKRKGSQLACVGNESHGSHEAMWLMMS